MSRRRWVWVCGVWVAIGAAVWADVPGDSDGDGDVDFDDFELLSLCSFGPEVPALSVCGELFDYDFDSDVDLADLAAMQRCFSGPNGVALADCADHIVRVEDGCLHVIGTSADTLLALRLAAGAPETLEIDVGSDGLVEFSVDRGLFDCIVIDARGGDDVVLIDELNGAFSDVEATTINGGRGNDTLIGGIGGELLRGGPGDDDLDCGAGDDEIVWDVGDGSDVINGSDGVDRVTVRGGSVAEEFVVVANGLRVRLDRLSPAPFSLDIGTVEQLALDAGGGDDSLACVGNLAALIQITADGGAGADTLLGSNGADLLRGGEGDDFVDGQQGGDVIELGAGNDTFQWDPGDGSDVVEGEAGEDLVLFNGSNASENYSFSANGGRLRFTRDVAAVTLDAGGIEQFELRALGGADNAVINDLSATELVQVTVALAGTLGGGAGDAQPDHVIVNGTASGDDVTIAGGITGTLVLGLSPIVNITTAEPASDRLIVNALDGDDTLDASGLGGGVIGLTLNGGAGNDALTGSGGADALNGDADNDTIIGGDGDDVVQLGAGDDAFVWSPGHNTDMVEGGEGVDVVGVNGGNGAEDFAIVANGTRVRFDRIDPAPFSLDINACEHLVLNANGGNDSLVCLGNLAVLIQITANGGTGEDTLLGSNGADVLVGGEDDDFIDGQQGNDTVLLGAGDDTFQWDPGDGSDIVDGQAGHDTMRFNGSTAAEIYDFSADGQRLRFTRNVGAIVMDLDGVEQFDLRALGGADSATVHDLSATDVQQVNIDLAGVLGGGVGDAQADIITVNGTPLPDAIDITANAGAVDVTGLAASVRIAHPEAGLDTLVVNGLDGTDTITPGADVTTWIMLSVNP